ncbi:MAG: CDP-alcohol phosphatidyltransferase family protein [bacterium]|nr:CDP-alcohol phosphatidyltransferase family protein [bacterium]
MRKKALIVLVWITRQMERLDRSRDGQFQKLLENRLLLPLIRIGLTANFLTGVRVVISLLIITYLAFNVANGYNPDFPLYDRMRLLLLLLAAYVTDAFDGPLAKLSRRLGYPASRHGAHLDPLADKILTLPIVAYYLMSVGLESKVIMLLTIAGDLAATWIRSVAGKNGITIPSNIFGKYKMAFLCAAIAALVLWYPKSQGWFLILATVSLTCGTVSVVSHLLKLREELALKA